MKKDLKQRLKIHDLEISRDGFSCDNLIIIMKQLWCQDSFKYRGRYPERARIQLSVSILLYCFTSARTGEVHESIDCRRSARERGDYEDGNLDAAVMVVCYKVSNRLGYINIT